MSLNEYVVLVDEHDNAIGIAEKLAAHQAAQLHRAFSIFIIRNTPEGVQILLQRRQLHKYHSAGLWSNTCCSHPMPGETILAAGQRRLQEEMGIQAELKEIASFKYKAEVAAGLIEHEYDHILLGTFSGDDIPFNPDEVASSSWVELQALQQDLKQHPEKYTAWFSQALALLLPHLSK